MPPTPSSQIHSASWAVSWRRPLLGAMLPQLLVVGSGVGSGTAVTARSVPAVVAGDTIQAPRSARPVQGSVVHLAVSPPHRYHQCHVCLVVQWSSGEVWGRRCPCPADRCAAPARCCPSAVCRAAPPSRLMSPAPRPAARSAGARHTTARPARHTAAHLIPTVLGPTAGPAHCTGMALTCDRC